MILWSLSNKEGDGYENVTKKWIRSASNLIALIPPRPIHQILENFSGAAFWKTALKFRKRKSETWNKDVSSRSRALTAKKCTTQKRDARFANLNLLLFCRLRCRRPHRCLSFLFECLRWSHVKPSLKNSFRKLKEGRELGTYSSRASGGRKIS